LACALFISACGGGSSGGTNENPSSRSSSSSSSVSSESSSSSSSVSSESSSSSSNLSSMSSSSSSVSTATIPNAATNTTPYCRIPNPSDTDGWGWENQASCVYFNSSSDPGVASLPNCLIGNASTPYCNTDNQGWGFENSRYCISTSLCPGAASKTQTAISSSLVNPNADTTAQAVYTYLKSVWGSKMLSGIMDNTWRDSTDMYQRVVTDTGKAPAIMGFDYMNFTIGKYDGQGQTDEAIAHWNRGGLVTFNWHWRDPSDATEQFYTKAAKDNGTDFEIPIANAQLDTSNANFTKMVADIDMVAGELQKLESAGVSVLWRPLHEANGGWFWWGKQRSDTVPAAHAQILLWQYMFDRLTTHHGLNNLIWVWNGQNAAWYPGDSYVDIVSHDIYDDPRSYDSQIHTYNVTLNQPFQTKLVALSENSNIPDPDAMQADGAWWLYFMVWNDGGDTAGVTAEDNFWTGEYYNTNAHKTHVYNHERVITLDELPDF